MARIASTVLVVALLAATAAAFALTQGLKLQKSPVLGTQVPYRVFSPVCECDRARAVVSFRLREPDRLRVEIVDGDRIVRTLEEGRSYPRGRVTVEWDGRDDAGEVLPEGEYRPRLRLAEARQTITLPNPIRIDVTRPIVQDVEIRPRVISPDGDGRGDRVVVEFRASEPARGALYVDGERRVLTRFWRTEQRLEWAGRVGGRALPAGTYPLSVAAVDRAGNESDATPPEGLRVRYVALGRTRITARAGMRFAIRVSADAERVRWSLAGRSGFAPPGTLRLRAPLQKGRFTLTVTANGRVARAAVFVREPSS